MKFVITDASQYASGKKGLSPEYIDKLKVIDNPNFREILDTIYKQ